MSDSNNNTPPSHHFSHLTCPGCLMHFHRENRKTYHLSHNPLCREAQSLLDAQPPDTAHGHIQQSAHHHSPSIAASSSPSNNDGLSPHYFSQSSSLLFPNATSEKDDPISPLGDVHSPDAFSPTIPPAIAVTSHGLTSSTSPADTYNLPPDSPDRSVPPTILTFPTATAPPNDDDSTTVNTTITEPSQHSHYSSENNNVAFHAQQYDLLDDSSLGNLEDSYLPSHDDGDNKSVTSELSNQTDPSLPALQPTNDVPIAENEEPNNTGDAHSSLPDIAKETADNYFQIGYLGDDSLLADATSLPPELKACDQSLFEKQQNFIKDTGAKDNATLRSKGYQFAVDLQIILRDAGAPLCVYDKVLDWTLRAEKAGLFPGFPRNAKYNADFKMPSRRELFNNLYQRFNLESMQPTRQRVLLPQANAHVWITTFDVKAALLSLLTNPELINDESLQFCRPGKGPWDRFPADDPRRSGGDPPLNHVYDDIQTGQRYFQAQLKLCSGDRDVLLPIILFIDKTHTDVKGNKTLEPVCMTLGIFNRRVRNTHKAWTVLGYIPNKLVYKSAKHAVERFSDFHFMLEHIVRPLKELLAGPGFRWVFDYAGKKYDSVVKGYLAFVCGDHEGQDKIAGHYLNRTEVKRICRYCDVTLEDSDDPYFDFTLTKQSVIDELIAKKKSDVLKELSYYCLLCPRALTGIECGEPVSPNARGYLLPTDILHSTQHGLQDYSKSSLVDSKRQTNQARKRALRQSKAKYQTEANERRSKKRRTENRSLASTATARNDPVYTVVAKNVSEDGDFYAPTIKTSKQDLQKIKIFSNSNIAHWEPILLRYGYLMNQQSDKDRPRTIFPNGVFSLTKVNAQETSGSLLLLLLFISSKYGEYLFADARYDQPAKKRNLGMMGDSRRKQWVQSLQQLLLYEATQKSGNVTHGDTKNLDMFMPHFLTMLKSTFCRGTGQGMKLLKFHVQVHVPGDIRGNGSLSNSDTASGESNHKVICKRTAKNTQHRLCEFDYQCAMRFSEDLVLDKAMSLVQRVYGPRRKKNKSSSFVGLRSNVFLATTDGIFSRGKSQNHAKYISGRLPWMKPITNWIDDCLYEEVNEFIYGLKKAAEPDQTDDSTASSGSTPPITETAFFSVSMFTEYYMWVDDNNHDCGRFHFRADPRWNKDKGIQEGRHDWANASLPDKHPVSVELRKQIARNTNESSIKNVKTPLASISVVSFLRLGGMTCDVAYGGTNVKDGDYCLFQAANLSSPALDTVPCILFRTNKMLKRGRDNQRPRLFLCPVECLVSPAIVVPDTVPDWKSPQRRGAGHGFSFSQSEYLVVEPRDEWCATFLEHVKDWCKSKGEKSSEDNNLSSGNRREKSPKTTSRASPKRDQSNASTSSSEGDSDSAVKENGHGSEVDDYSSGESSKMLC